MHAYYTQCVVFVALSLSKQALSFYYCSYIRPVLEYASIAWPGLPAHLRDRLERFQRRVFKVILRLPVFEHSGHDTLLLTVNQASIQSRREYRAALLGFQLANKRALQHLLDESFPTQTSTYSLRRSSFFQLPKPNTSYFQSSPIYFAAHIFNSLPAHLQTITKESEFKKAKQHLHSPICPCSHHIYWYTYSWSLCIYFFFNFTITLPYISARIIICNGSSPNDCIRFRPFCKSNQIKSNQKVSLQSCTQNRPSPKVQSRSEDWI